MAEQLNVLYTVPKKTAPNWVNENRMLLLLDGLDEVKQSNREKCVEAINQFRSEHGLTSLVICSCSQEYEELSKKLFFEGAIVLQPLTREQINEYFDKFGESLVPVKYLLEKDETLQEITETPLMLSIMTLAYQDAKPDDLPTSANIEEHREYIFNTYIERMFKRSTRTENSRFSKEANFTLSELASSKNGSA